MCVATTSNPERVSRFFVSAAEYLGKKPWKIVDSTAVFVIHFPQSKATRFFSVLGAEERDRGILMAYSDSDLILMHKRRRDPQIMARPAGSRGIQPNPSGLRSSHRTPLAVVFKPKNRVPFDVIEEATKYDWVLGDELPFIMEYGAFRDGPGNTFQSSTSEDPDDLLEPTTCKDEHEVKYLDVALRAIPLVVEERFQEERNPKPFRHMCNISTGEQNT